jgi:hypothetical protein
MISVLVLTSITDSAPVSAAALEHAHFLDHAPADRVRVEYANFTATTLVAPQWLTYDVVLLDASLLRWRGTPSFQQLMQRLEWLMAYQGIVAAMPDEEHRFAHVLEEVLLCLRTKIVFTGTKPVQRPFVYPHLQRRAYFTEAQAVYVHPARLAEAQQIARPGDQRNIDLTYRAQLEPYWLGTLGHQRTQLAVDSPRRLQHTGLRLDIAVGSDETSDACMARVAASRAMLGADGGSSVLDRRGEMEAHVQALLSEQPDLAFADADTALGHDLSRHRFAALDFATIAAVMTRTAMVLVEGTAAGVLTPHTHYIPVSPDLSNLEAAVDALRDSARVAHMTEQAYTDVVLSGRLGYERLASQFLDVADVFVTARAKALAQAA